MNNRYADTPCVAVCSNVLLCVPLTRCPPDQAPSTTGTYIHICINTYMCAYMRTYIHTFRLTYIHIHLHACTHTNIQTNRSTYIHELYTYMNYIIIHTYIHELYTYINYIIVHTTGHSTNYIRSLELPAGDFSSEHWVRRSVALLASLDT